MKFSIGNHSEALQAFLHELPGMSALGPLLVLVHDGFRLEGYLFKVRRGKDAELLGQGQSNAIQFAVAVADICGQLPIKPRRAVLASATVTTALLDLPVSGDAPRPAAEMLGLVRWEMEPLLAEQIQMWAIGNILLCAGYASRNDIDRILADQKESRLSGESPRVGDLAIRLGVVSRKQVEECVSLQSQLLSLDGQVVCGWSPKALQQLPGGRSLWQAVAMDLTVQSRWVAACEKLDIRLESILPLTSAALPLLRETTGLVLEVHPNSSAIFRLANGVPTELVSQVCDNSDVQAISQSLLTERLTPDDGSIWYVSYLQDSRFLIEELTRELQHDLVPVTTSISGITAAAALGVVNKDDKAFQLPRLPGSEPPPPAIQRPQTWAALVGLLLLVCIAGYESYGYWRKSENLAQVQELIAQKGKLAKRGNEANLDKQKADAARAELVKVHRELASLRGELDFHQQELGGREAFVDRLLSTLPEVTTENTLITSVIESAWYQVEIHAWSTSQDAGYKLARDLTGFLTEWRIVIGDVVIREQLGFGDSPGYDVKIQLHRKPPGDAPKQESKS